MAVLVLFQNLYDQKWQLDTLPRVYASDKKSLFGTMMFVMMMMTIYIDANLISIINLIIKGVFNSIYYDYDNTIFLVIPRQYARINLASYLNLFYLHL